MDDKEMTECDFSLRHYKETLERALDMEYSFLTMSMALEYNKNFDKIICLRHDADYFRDVQLSKNFSEIEDKLGIPATYFFRLHADYNLFSPENYRAIKSLWRHEIGLHYEFDFGKLVGDKPENLLKRELNALKSMVNRQIKGIAYHCPTRCGYPLTSQELNKMGVLYEAYDDSFTFDMKYISDSSGWREGCLCEWLGKEKKIVALMHQIHWYHDTPIETF